MRKLRGDDALVGNVAGEYAHVARELVHAGDEAPRDRGVVIGKVPANELGDQLGLGRRKKLAADLGGARDVLLQRGVRLHHGVDDGRRGLGRAFDQPVGRGDRGHGVVEARLWPVAAPHVEHHGSDPAAYRDLVPMPLAQKPSILRSSSAFAAVTPKLTPAPCAPGTGAIFTWSRERSIPASISRRRRPISTHGAAPMLHPFTTPRSPRLPPRSLCMTRNQYMP